MVNDLDSIALARIAPKELLDYLIEKDPQAYQTLKVNKGGFAVSDFINEIKEATMMVWMGAEFFALGRGAISVMSLERSVEKAYVSGFKEIMKKARASSKGDVFAKGELEAAKYLRSQGYNVHFQTPGATRSGAGGTTDFLVGGAARSGKGGVPIDLYTPFSNNINNIVTNLAKKNSQAKGVIVNLNQTKLEPSQFGDLLKRVQGKGKTNIQKIFLFKGNKGFFFK